MRRNILNRMNWMFYCAAAFAWCGFVSPCFAQEPCTPQWQATFGGLLNINSSIFDFATFDDRSGAGPAIYISGAFTTAGGALVNRIAKWNSNQNRWDALAGGMDRGEVRAMIVFDDGEGPALFAGGSFSKSGGVTTNGIARWNGTSWSSLGGGVSHSSRSSSVNALALHDDGSGPALYAGGVFDQAGGENVQNVARWNSEFWSAVGTGLSSVNTLLSADLGDGLALYAGGQLNGLGQSDANYVARWDGQQWTAVGQSLGLDTDAVHDLILFDDGAGTGPALYAGGDFNLMKKSPAPHTIARFNGTEWEAVGESIVNEDGEYISVRALAVYDDLTGRGPALYAALLGGTFQNFARWDGKEWEFIDAGTSGKTYATSVQYDYASQVSMLLVGGETITSGTPIGAVRRFNPRTRLWHTFERGLDGDVNALQIIEEKDKENPSLYVGGTFTSADGLALHNVGRWNNGEWTALESGTDGGVECFATFDENNDGDEELFVGGYFTLAGQKIVNKIAVWNGHTWSDVGGGVGVDAFPFDAVHAMVTHDDGSGNSLYVAGAFLTAGSVQAYNIARWDGTSWFALGDGLINRVRVLAVFDDGSDEGPCLYAGGEFTAAGDVPAQHIARWNGSEWSALGEGTNGFYVLSLAVYDDQLGAGPALYVGGYFSMAGSEIVNHIAKWDGEAWSSLRGGAPGLSQISALSVFSLKPGGPPSLLVGGHFTQIGGVQAKSVALWDGVAWSQMPPGINEIGRYVSALAVHDDDTGAGPTVFAGGNFLSAPGGDSYLAKWQGCPILDIKGDISGDGRVNSIDILRMFAQWGACGTPCPPNCNADIAGRGAETPDCVVDAHDLFVLLAHWTN